MNRASSVCNKDKQNVGGRMNRNNSVIKTSKMLEVEWSQFCL
jgi:hypothetical protein